MWLNLLLVYTRTCNMSTWMRGGVHMYMCVFVCVYRRIYNPFYNIVFVTLCSSNFGVHFESTTMYSCKFLSIEPWVNLRSVYFKWKPTYPSNFFMIDVVPPLIFISLTRLYSVRKSRRRWYCNNYHTTLCVLLIKEILRVHSFHVVHVSRISR